MLDRPASALRLVSGAARPSDTRPWLDDRLRLGVCIRRIVLPQHCDRREVPVEHLPAARGWHDVERLGEIAFRWTDGDAEIPGEAPIGILEITLAGEMLYPVASPLRPTQRPEQQRFESAAA